MEATMSNLPFLVYKDKYHLPIFTTAEYVEEFEAMEVREDDVFIVTYPKSGTHWMQEMVHLIFADGQPEKVTANERRLVVEMADVRSPELVSETDPGFRLMKDLPSPRVFSTHVVCPLLPRMIWQKQCKMIYVYRHPKDVIVSFYNFHRVLRERFAGLTIPDTPDQFELFFTACLDGQIEYGSWFDHLLSYEQHREKDFFLFVSYEDMKKNIHTIVSQVGKFLGRELNEDTVERIVENSSFQSMKGKFQKDENVERTDLDVFLNKGEMNQWQSRFTKEQNKRCDEMFLRKMKDCDLTRCYAPVQ
ncbi:putative amine sulfotransferase-like [Apostichopus japonicus]|uniref:Putative amine sulfotransferase-like n=1 Tax=Stichopus japonicus TaxID=307972 RepID=A0A2G8L429_STIJA|nr:putative amine sulfotransferase-like [Apostichopus japonicus]